MEQSVVRLATDSDAIAINIVSQYLGYPEQSNSEATQKLSDLIASTNEKVYVAELSGEVVGWIHLSFVRRLASDNYFEIGGLVVLPTHRRAGIGKKLVKIAIFENPGKMRVRSNQLRVEAHKFYERLGFNGNKNQRVFEYNS